MSNEKYTTADVIYIPHSALNNTYDDQPNTTQNPYGQVILNNIINTSISKYSKCKIGSYIYRSVSDDYKTLVPYKYHIKGFMEPNAGAHYYVMSGYSDLYSKASCEVKLSEISCYRAGHRNGFIALSLFTGNVALTDSTKINQCDIGLIYTRLPGKNHDAWYPVSWCRDNNTGSNFLCDNDGTSGFVVGNRQDNFEIPSGATVKIEIHVKIEMGTDGKYYDIIEGNIYCNGNSTAYAKIRYRALRGSFFTLSKNKPYIRFTRFMSLVPVENVDTDDGSGVSGDYVDESKLHGIMRNCKLNSTPWNNNLIAFAWSVQGVNITSLKISTLAGESIAPDADECNIYTHYPTHMKNIPNV